MRTLLHPARNAISRATAHALKVRERTISEIENFEDLKERAKEIKDRVISRTEENISLLKDNLRKNGFYVFEATDVEETNLLIKSILNTSAVKRVVKSKSMVTEEIKLNAFLKREGIEVVETDLGEWIIQLSEETPEHIVAPAIHKTKEEIADLFEKKFDVQIEKTPRALTAFVREKLRDKFLLAQAGITGCNFAVSKEGTLVMVENEGNLGLVLHLPDYVITILGIEKIIPDIKSLPVFLSLLAPSATGQKTTTYIHLLKKPSAKKHYVILIDNGRRKIANSKLCEVLRCIRCGACANVCPVYERVGGKSYISPYTGPIGAILGPLLSIAPLSLCNYSSLCGACDEICPVKIPLTKLFLKLRQFNFRNAKSSEKLFHRLFSLLSVYPLSKTIDLIYPIRKFLKKKEIYSLPSFLNNFTRERILQWPFQK